MTYHHTSISATTEITTRHEGPGNLPTTRIRNGNEVISVTGHPRCSIFHVMHRIDGERRGTDVTELDLWTAGASHNEVVASIERYMEANRVLGVFHACPTCTDAMTTCPTCNGSGEVMGLLAA